MDGDRLRAAKAGDAVALNAVARWFSLELLKYLRSHVPHDVARDLAQETVVEVLAKLGEAPEDPRVFLRWVRGFGRNMVRRWWRKSGRYGAVLAEVWIEARSPVLDLEADFGAHEQLELLDAAVDELASPFRSTLRLRLDRPGVPARELAAELGVAEGTVHWRLMVAREQVYALVAAARITRTPYRAGTTSS